VHSHAPDVIADELDLADDAERPETVLDAVGGLLLRSAAPARPCRTSPAAVARRLTAAAEG
jgi:hypothetical protein